MLKRLKIVFVIFCIAFIYCTKVNVAYGMPFFSLKNQSFCLRSSFFTTFYSSKEERVNNIEIASKSIDGIMIESGGEFSFNKVVGERSEKRGYKKAVAIIKGEFTESVGGGVCQVSSTLYNAVILADLKIVEYHPHSLPVSYVAPSFDAMVSWGYADLRFENNTL